MSFIRRPGTISALQFYQLVRFGSLLLISILLTKAGLSATDIGLYESVLFLVGLLSFFWINGYIQSFLAIHREYTLPDQKHPGYVNAAGVLFLFALLAVVIFLISAPFLELSIWTHHRNDLLPILLIYLLVSAPTALVEYIYLLEKQAGKLIRYSLWSHGIQVGLVGILIFMGHGLMGALVGLLASAVVRLVWLIALLRRWGQFQVNVRFITTSLFTAWPLILLALVGGSASYIDGSVVAAYFDEAHFAIFRYGARELPFVVLFANAFSNAMVPHFSNPEALEENLQTLKKKALQLAHFFFPITFALLLTSHFLFPILFNPDFAASASIFNIYLLIISSRLVFPQTILYGMRDNTPVLWIGIFALGVHLLTSLGLVSVWGLQGVALAAVVANLVEKTILAYYLHKKHGISIKNYLHLNWWILYNSVLLIVYFLSIQFI